MSRSKWDKILGLAWVAYGVAPLSYGAYWYVRDWRYIGDHLEEIVQPLLGAAVFLLPLVAGGIGIVLRRKWAWTAVLVVSLLTVVISAFSLRALIFDIWPRHFELVQVIRTLVPNVVFWGLTIWTAVRFFSRPRPWQTQSIGET